MNYNIMYVIALILSFVATVLISRKLIPILKSHKMGQTILEIGPRWHKSKEGTPTMGGIAFIIPDRKFAVVDLPLVELPPLSWKTSKTQTARFAFPKCLSRIWERISLSNLSVNTEN